MAQGVGTRQWTRGPESARALSELILGNGEMIVTDEGFVYAGDGQTRAKNLLSQTAKTLGWTSVVEAGAVPAAVVLDATVAAGSTSISSPGGKFTAAMNGKKFYLRRGGPVLVTGVDAWEASPLIGTFTYVSATAGTLSVAATTAVSAGEIVIGSDATAAFNKALATGYAHIPPNTSFIVEGEIVVGSGQILEGSSRDSSRIFSVAQRANVVTSHHTDTPVVRNLSIHGNGFGAQPTNTWPGAGNAPNWANSGCGVIFAKVSHGLVDNVATYHCGGDGVTSGRNGIAGIYLTHGCTESLVNNSRAKWCRNGINEDNYFVDVPNQAYASPLDNTIENCITSYCRFGVSSDSGSLARGFRLINHTATNCVINGGDIHSVKYVTIIGGMFAYNGRPLTAPGLNIYGTGSTVLAEHIILFGVTFFANGTHGVKISDYVKDYTLALCKSVRNGRHGAYMNTQANDGSVVFCTFRRNGAATDNPGEYDGVRITSCTRVSVAFINAFDDAAEVSETPTQNWGVRADGTSDAITVDENSRFRSNVAGAVKLTGASSRYGAKTRAQILALAQGIKGESFPRTTASGGLTMPSGQVFGSLVPFLGGDIITNVVYQQTAAATGLTLAKLGVWDQAGNLLASTADFSTAANAGTGVRSYPLTTPLAVPEDTALFIGLLVVGTTGAQVLRGTSGITGYGGLALGSFAPPSVGSATGRTDVGTYPLSASGNAIWVAWS